MCRSSSPWASACKCGTSLRELCENLKRLLSRTCQRVGHRITNDVFLLSKQRTNTLLLVMHERCSTKCNRPQYFSRFSILRSSLSRQAKNVGLCSSTISQADCNCKWIVTFFSSGWASLSLIERRSPFAAIRTNGTPSSFIRAESFIAHLWGVSG